MILFHMLKKTLYTVEDTIHIIEHIYIKEKKKELYNVRQVQTEFKILHLLYVFKN